MHLTRRVDDQATAAGVGTATASERSLLFLVPSLPYPPVSGGDIRAYHFLRRLSRHFDVYLLAQYGGPDIQLWDEHHARLFAETGIGALCIPDREHQLGYIAPRTPLAWRLQNTIKFWRGAPHGLTLDIDPDCAREVQRLVADHRFDAVMIDHLFMMQYARFVRPLPVFYSATDVETTKFKRWYSADEPISLRRRVLHRAQGRMIQFHESRVSRTARAVFATSETDRDALQRLNKDGSGRFVVAANGVDLEYFQARSRESFEQPPAVLFVGTMFYKPNQQAADFLAHEVFPRVRERIADATCHIAGKTWPHVDYSDLHRPERGVYMHGFVPDVRPYMARSQILVAPLFIGSGTRIKILEAMATGTPVVSTAIGAEGIDYTDGENIVIADSAADIAAAIVDLLNDRQRCARIGAAGRRLVERQYTWDASADIVRNEIVRVLGEG